MKLPLTIDINCLGINEWNGIEIDGNVVRIGHQTYYKDNKDELWLLRII